MKYSVIFISSLIFHTNAFAEHPAHYLGKFAGTEKIVITCSNTAWNKSETRKWKTNHSDLNGNSYKGLTEAGGGKYKVEGTISGINATGTFKGKDGFGNACSGDFTDTLNGDELKAIVNGSCPSVKCEFTGDVTAKRQ